MITSLPLHRKSSNMEFRFSKNTSKVSQQLIRRVSTGRVGPVQSNLRIYNYPTTDIVPYNCSLFPNQLNGSHLLDKQVPVVDVWRLPLSIDTLKQHINITKLSQVTLPNLRHNFEIPGLNVLRHWFWQNNRQQQQTTTTCSATATEVHIPPQTLLIYHSKSLEVGVPQYFVLLGPGPNWAQHEVRVVRASRQGGQDEILLEVKPIANNLLTVGLARARDFSTTLQPRFCTFENTTSALAPAARTHFNNQVYNRTCLLTNTSNTVHVLGTPIPVVTGPASRALTAPKVETQTGAPRRRKQVVKAKANPTVAPPESIASRVAKVTTPGNTQRKQRGKKAPAIVDISGEEPSLQNHLPVSVNVNFGIGHQTILANQLGQPLSGTHPRNHASFETVPSQPLKENLVLNTYNSLPCAMAVPHSVSSAQTSLSEPPHEPEFSPEDAIKEIREMITNTLPNTYFTAIPCEWIRIASYKVLSEQQKAQGSQLMATVSSKGIYFELPHFQSRSSKECVILCSHIIKMETHLSEDTHVLIITVNAKQANWLLENLGMPSCETSQTGFGELNSFVILKLNEEDFTPFHKVAIERISVPCEEISKEAVSSKLIESSPQSILLGVKRSSSNDYCSSNVTATSAESAGGQTSAPPRKLRKTEPAQDEPCTPIFNPFTGELHKLLQRHSFEISNADLMSLGSEQFLNDQIIDYWLTEIWSNLPEHIQQRTHVFSTYFYKRLTTTVKKKSYSFENDASLSGAQKKHRRVMKWTKNVDLFSKDYVVIPINEDSHWFLAVICFPGLEMPQTFDGKDKHYNNLEISFFDKSDPESKKTGKVVITRHLDDPMFKASTTKVYTPSEILKANLPPLKAPCILVFDSLRNENNHTKVYLHLRTYLEMEYLLKKGVERKFNKITIAGFQPTVPQQPNHCDCGIYVLKYVEMLLGNSLPTFALPIPKMEDWFPESAITTKRKEIFESIVQHIKLEAPEKEIYIPQVKFQQPLAPETSEVTESKLLEGTKTVEADNEKEEEELPDLDDVDETRAETTEDSSLSAGSGEAGGE